MKVLERHDPWLKVSLQFDNYVGWIDKKQIVNLNEEEFSKTISSPTTATLDIVQIVIYSQSNITPVVLGSTLPNYFDKKFKIGAVDYIYDGNVKTFSSPDASKLIEHAYMYLNAPYLWGGRSPFGIDCSGYTQMVFKLCGIALQRDAHQQAQQGTTINSVGEARPGDLAFFNNPEGKIVHVGIVLPNNKIIHASGKVHIDKLDKQGIFSEETNKYTHNLRLIKRIF
jgi:cell wall-associated NlpC family hydrolase